MSKPPQSQAELQTLLAELLPRIRSDLIPDLVDEIVQRVRSTVPAYARPPESPYNPVIRAAVERNVVGFVDRLTDPGGPLDRRDELCRKIGAFEVLEGRPLAVLRSAYRIGTQVAWARIRALLSDRASSALAVSTLAESLLSYMDEAAALSREGYERTRTEADEQREASRLRVLRALVGSGEPVASHPAAGWPIPAEVTLVALSPGTLPVCPLLDPDVLMDPQDPEPYLLVPGPFTRARRRMLETALAGSRAAAGLSVPTARARHSLRWARRLLGLGDVLCDGTLTLCEDHMMSLWLLSDEALMDQITRRRLAPLAQLSERRRQPLIDTLSVWLRTRAPATRISEQMDLHVQTIRYRMRTLDVLLGTELTDPDTRFATEAALRAQWVRSRGPCASSETNGSLPSAATTRAD
jgi:hypothetical protein